MTATDPVNNTTAAQVNYRVLQPWLVTDPNQNRTGARYDQLGMVTAVAVMGKELGGTDQGDHLDLTTDEAAPGDDPTTTYDYDLSAYQTWADGPAPDPDHPAPVWSHSRARVRHKDPATPWLETYTYTDGLGRVALVKAQAESGQAPERDANGTLVRAADGSLVFAYTQTRWVGSGRVVYDNKANPVKAYEPFFDSSSVYDDESDLVEWGVTAVTSYDPLNRAIRVDKPDGSYTSVQFGPWRTLDYDENDNVLSSSWYAARRSGQLGGDQQDAAAKAKADANTPSVTDFDTLGRVFRAVADNSTAGQYQTILTLDISGRVLATTDALGRVVMATTYAMPGNIIIRTEGGDSGHRWLLPATDGNLLRSWDDRQHVITHSYDAARRPTGVTVSTSGARPALAERLVYGEGAPSDVADNLRTAVYQAYSGAGVATTVSRDFQGNIVQASQQLLTDVPVTSLPDWSAAPPPALDPVTLLTSSTSYDALNRVSATTTPDGSVTAFTWGERSLLAQVALTLPGGTATDYVTAVSYDPKGQRQSVSYGNGAVTVYTYDPETFRLVQLVTTRPTGAGPGPLQNLSYTYDPVGNITRIVDAAKSTVFFANQLVAPVGDYTYDAIYRLTVATGREHLGQAPDAPTGSDDTPFQSTVLPSDATAMRNYTEYYAYDFVGNISSVRHVAVGGSWTRTYNYAAISANNQLTSTQAGMLTEPYSYDPHGNMTSMFGLPVLAWDFKDQLQTTSRSSASGPQPATWYRYGQSGNRVRKISFTAAGIPQNERIYFGNYEIYRSYDNTGTLTLERQTVIVPDGAKHLALVETSYDKTKPASPPVTTVRYQFSNHLGSACLELDQQAAVLTYEEYFPFGATSFIAGRSAAEVSLKRYRYTGKERDAENGLYYHGARYYAAWLGRWIAVDPSGIPGAPGYSRAATVASSLYAALADNPIRFTDPDGRNPVSHINHRGLLKHKAHAAPSSPKLTGAPGSHHARGATHPEKQAAVNTADKQRRSPVDPAAPDLKPREGPGKLAQAWEWLKEEGAPKWQWLKEHAGAGVKAVFKVGPLTVGEDPSGKTDVKVSAGFVSGSVDSKGRLSVALEPIKAKLGLGKTVNVEAKAEASATLAPLGSSDPFAFGTVEEKISIKAKAELDLNGAGAVGGQVEGKLSTGQQKVLFGFNASEAMRSYYQRISDIDKELGNDPAPITFRQQQLQDERNQ